MNDLTLYYQHRQYMKTGDLLTYRTDGAISWAIRKWSPGANHAGMVLDLSEYAGEEYRRWTLEATSKGPRLAYLSVLLGRLHGECYWHGLRPEILEMQRNEAGCWALEQQGVVKYDFKGILQYPFRKVSADFDKLVCSEYVQFSWAKGNIISMAEGERMSKPSDLPLFGVTLPPVLIVKSDPATISPPVITTQP